MTGEIIKREVKNAVDLFSVHHHRKIKESLKPSKHCHYCTQFLLSGFISTSISFHKKYATLNMERSEWIWWKFILKDPHYFSALLFPSLSLLFCRLHNRFSLFSLMANNFLHSLSILESLRLYAHYNPHPFLHFNVLCFAS